MKMNDPRIPENRRRFARVTLESRVEIRLSGVDARRKVFLDNISAGGLFIVTQNPKPIGTKLSFEFSVRDGAPSVIGKGIVRWVESDLSKTQGMGIQFLELNEEGKKELMEVLRLKKNS